MASIIVPLTQAAKSIVATVFSLMAVIYTLSGLALAQVLRVAVWFMQPVLRISGMRRAAKTVPAMVLLVTHVVALIIVIINTRHQGGLGTHIMLPAFVFLSAVMATTLRYLKRSPLTVADIERLVVESFPERWFCKHLRNPIDAYFVRLVIYSTITMIPAWVVILFASMNEPWPYVYFLICYFGNSAKHESLDHTNMHNRLFTPRHDTSHAAKQALHWFDFYLIFILNPVCLRISHFYDIQHIYVHHVENNGPDDTQSTIVYDRTSFIDFCRFALKLSLDFSIGASVIPYLIRKGRYKQLKIILKGLLLWMALLFMVGLVNPMTAIFVLFARAYAGLLGAPDAYSWHGFADPDEPENIHQNSVNLVVMDEHGNLGAGFHIEHHLKPGLHWSKFANFSCNQLIKHRDERSLTWFYGNGFYSGVTLLKALWLDRMDLLLPLVSIDGHVELSKKDIILLLKARTQPIKVVKHSLAYQLADMALGRFAANALIWAPLPPEGFSVDIPDWKARQIRESTITTVNL